MERLRLRSETDPNISNTEEMVLDFFIKNTENALVVCTFLEDPYGDIEIRNDPDILYLIYEKRNDLVKLHIADGPYAEEVLKDFSGENKLIIEILLTKEFINTTEKIFLEKFKKSSLKENETLLEKVMTGFNCVQFYN